MPHIGSQTPERTSLLKRLAAEQRFWDRYEREMATYIREKRVAVAREMSNTFAAMGVPTDGRIVIINDGTEGEEAGVYWEDETAVYDGSSRGWRERTAEELSAWNERAQRKAKPDAP